MKRIVWDEMERVAQYVADRTGEPSYEKCTAIGLEEDSRLIAGVVFQNHTGPSVLMHVASDKSKRWMTPAFLCASFFYPFKQLKVRRITGLVRADNLVTQEFDEHIGFKREGVLREGAADGVDLIVYGMLKKECRFLSPRYIQALGREMHEYRKVA